MIMTMMMMTTTMMMMMMTTTTMMMMMIVQIVAQPNVLTCLLADYLGYLLFLASDE